MYKFEDTTKHEIKKTLPSEALCFDGKFIENEVDGYRTLSVTGRELVAYNVNNQAFEGGDRALLLSANRTSREIVISYKLIAKTSTELLKKFNKLNKLLSKQEAVFYFNDEKEYEYRGTLSQADVPEKGTLSIVSSFTILCSDPFKYQKLKDLTGSGSISVPYECFYETLPGVLEITLKKATDKIVVKNSDKTISFSGTFKTGDMIKIDFNETDVYRNNVKNQTILDWTSDLENFFITKNSTISVTPADSGLKMIVKEVSI